MKNASSIGMLLLVTTAFFGCNGQTRSASAPAQSTRTGALVGGGCDGCEIMYVGMPSVLNATDTSAGWKEIGQKLLVTGIIYQRDGKTPAPNVILYYYHTDNNGYYSPAPGLDEKARRHGHLRGWIKTDKSGRYAFYTLRPAPYPNRNIPAHIHPSVKEPDIATEYYLDEFVFDDDPLLTEEKRKVLEDRGGNGILHVVTSNGVQRAEHNIVLGLNIPNYPVKK